MWVRAAFALLLPLVVVACDNSIAPCDGNERCDKASPDAGAGAADAGPPGADAGPPPADAGASSPDAGTPSPDAGAAPADAGAGGVPAGWTCDAAWYDDSDCDCGCGVDDPTCGVSYTASACDFALACGGVDRVDPADPTRCLEPSAGGCGVTLCLTGAVDQSSASNFPFQELCAEPSVPGLIQDCESGTCHSTFNNVLVDLETEIYPYLFAALDTNGDGAVNDDDEPCAVNLLGYSWGGVNVVELAQVFLSDPSVSASRAVVDKLIVIDPYQPLARVDVPAGVTRFWEYRHSSSPAHDCSNSAPLGPYRGIAPTCVPGASCVDYDYSLAPDQWFSSSYSGGSYAGADVGHCIVAEVAYDPALANLLDAPWGGPLPPTVPVAAP